MPSEAGVVVVASAGNDGTNYYMAGAPASGDGVISVAATDATPTYPGAKLTFDGGSIQALNSNGATFTDGTGYRVRRSRYAGRGGARLHGRRIRGSRRPGALVVTQRGTCARVDRATLAQAAGAAAVAMINTDAGLSAVRRRDRRRHDPVLRHSLGRRRDAHGTDLAHRDQRHARKPRLPRARLVHLGWTALR